MNSWTQRDEMNFISRIGEHGPRVLNIDEKIRRVEGYLRAMEMPRRWDTKVFAIDLKMVALSRLEELEKLKRALNGRARPVRPKHANARAV